MARELLYELRELVQGVYMMPAFNRFDLVAEIIEEVRSATLGEHRPAALGVARQGGD